VRLKSCGPRFKVNEITSDHFSRTDNDPRPGLPRRGQGRRHPRQQHLPGRVHLRQPDDRGQRHPRRAPARRAEAAVPRLLLHLPAPRPPAHARGRAAHRPLEPTNEPYAIAKIAGIKLCESYNRQYGRDYRSVMPTNLYGPERQLPPREQPRDPRAAAPLPRSRAAERPEVVIWGTGTPMREFLHVDDMAEACVHVMNLDEATYRAARSRCSATSTSAPARTAASANWPRPSPASPASGPPDLRCHQARRHAAQAS
jgi:hypothetical protein